MNKAKIFKFFIISILVVIILNGYIVQASTSKNRDFFCIEEVEDLLLKRLETINKALYEEDFNIESIKLDLEQIERGLILEEDLANIQKLKESPTDIEYVHNLQVLDVCNIEEEDNFYNLQVKIIWYMYDYEEKEVEVEVTYNIEIIKKNDRYYLSAIRPMEK